MCRHSYCPHQMFDIYLLFPGTTGFFLHLLSNKSTSRFSRHVSHGLCTSVFRADPYPVSVGCQGHAREAEIGEEPRICLQMVEVGSDFKNPGQSSQRGVKREGHGRGCLSHGETFLRKQMECPHGAVLWLHASMKCSPSLKAVTLQAPALVGEAVYKV